MLIAFHHPSRRDQLDDLTSWAADIREYALSAALSGTRFDGWKLVEGRANRRYTDEAAVAQAVISSGHDPYERKLLGITAMERMLGKKQFSTLLRRPKASEKHREKFLTHVHIPPPRVRTGRCQDATAPDRRWKSWTIAFTNTRVNF